LLDFSIGKATLSSPFVCCALQKEVTMSLMLKELGILLYLLEGGEATSIIWNSSAWKIWLFLSIDWFI
jgi:hypothetical protein